MKTLNQFLSESKTSIKDFEHLVHIFLPYVFKELNIKSIPPLHFDGGKHGLHIDNIPGVTVVKDSGFSQKKGTFGQTSKKNRIVVNIKNRHPLDALRTLAHELVHYHQHITGVYGTGETGSNTENESNIRAGIIMRNFDFSHPDVFKMGSLE